jgi:hypothetical protein
MEFRENSEVGDDTFYFMFTRANALSQSPHTRPIDNYLFGKNDAFGCTFFFFLVQTTE